MYKNVNRPISLTNMTDVKKNMPFYFQTDKEEVNVLVWKW